LLVASLGVLGSLLSRQEHDVCPIPAVTDCKDPELLARFWAAALGYVLEPPPGGFATSDD
jgi:hypothetical protein